MRVFAAVRIGSTVRDALAAAVTRLRADPELDAAVKWVKAENLHLTLQFLGEVPLLTVSALVSALTPPVSVTPLTLSLGDVAVFPVRGRPRGIWVDLGGDVQRLDELLAAVQARLTTCGYPPDGQPFRPHVTLGRLRRGRVVSRGVLRERLRTLELRAGEWSVAEVVLLESRLGRSGPTYHVLAETPLGG